MSHDVELQVEVDAPVARVWAAFTDGSQRSQWEANEYEIDARQGGRYRWAFPGFETQGTVEVCETERRLVQSDEDGGHTGTRQSFSFATTPGGGTRIELLHEGLPSEEVMKSVSLAWSQVLADLTVFLDYGVSTGRFLCPMQHLGLWPDDRPEGLVILSVDEEGIAARAGLQPGDLLLTIDRVPVFTRPELWVLMRAAQPGDSKPVEFIRNREKASVDLRF